MIDLNIDFTDKKLDLDPKGVLDEAGITAKLLQDDQDIILSLSIAAGKTSLPDFSDTADDMSTEIAPWCRRDEIPEGQENTPFAKAIGLCKQITAIKLEDGFETIGTYAFYNLDNITKIILPDSLITIKANAFAETNSALSCDLLFGGNLQKWCSLNFGTALSNPLNLATAFYTEYTDGISLSSQVVSIDLSSFISDIPTVNKYAFYNYTALKELIFPADGQQFEIKKAAFYNCDNITLLNIPKPTVTGGTYAIGDMAFGSDTSAAQPLTAYIPEEIILGGAVFNGRSNVTIRCDLAITSTQNNLIKNEPAAFTTICPPAWNATWFEGVSFTTNCSWSSVKESGCTKLGLYWEQSFEDTITIVGYNQDILLTPPADNIAHNWEVVEIDKQDDNIITEQWLSITIPNNINSLPVTKIAPYAFSNCYALNKVIINKNLEQLGECAFYGCGNIKQFIVNDNTHFKAQPVVSEAIDYQRLYTNLFSSDGHTLYQYATGAPISCYTLTSNVSNISAGAFAHSSSLQYLIISLAGDTTYTYGWNAFDDCTMLEAVIINNVAAWSSKITFTNNKSNPLYYAKILRNYNMRQEGYGLPDMYQIIEGMALNVDKIKPYTFYNCESLNFTQQNSFVLLDAKTIGDYAFYGCTNLKYLRLTATITEIGESAFGNCPKLATISYIDGEIPATFASWCAIDFKNKFANPLYYDYIATRKDLSTTNIVLPNGNGIYLAKRFDIAPWITSGSDSSYIINTGALPGNITKIPECTFAGASIKDYGDFNTFLSTVQTIGDYAFYSADFSTDSSFQLKISAETTSIGVNAFADTDIAQITIAESSNPLTIHDCAFANLKLFSILELPCERRINFGDACFKDSFVQANLTIPTRYYDRVDITRCKKMILLEDGTSLSATAFLEAKELEELEVTFKDTTIQHIFNNITADSFKECKKLAKLSGDVKAANANYSIIGNCLIYNTNTHKILVFGANNANPIETGATKIQDRAFAYRTFKKNQSFEFPRSLQVVGKDIFYQTTYEEAST